MREKARPVSKSRSEASGVQWRRDGEIHWCPGCGNYAILDALADALEQLKVEPWQVCIVSGIGQAGKLPHHLRCNFLHGLHGRTLAHAEGVKLANPELLVVAVGGDGDIYGEGGGHLVHALRRNLDITCLVHNNGVYGLTKGQPSPTAGSGYVTRISPHGTSLPGLNPLTLAIAAGGTFVSRGFVGRKEHLVSLIVRAVKHRGFGFVDMLQPCVTYNKVNTYRWYEERVYDLAETGHVPTDKGRAFERALEWPGSGGRRRGQKQYARYRNTEVAGRTEQAEQDTKIPIGVFYAEQRKTYEEQEPALREGLLVDGRPSLEKLEATMAEFR